jgi:hypothetical protein
MGFWFFLFQSDPKPLFGPKGRVLQWHPVFVFEAFGLDSSRKTWHLNP